MSRALHIGVTLTLVMMVLAAIAHAQSNLKSQKKELDKIQKDVTSSKQRLDSLKREEGRVQSELSEYDERISSQQKLLGRLGSQLQGLRNEIKQAQNQLSSGERTLETSRNRYLGSVRRLYLTLPRQTENLVESPQNELEKKRQVTYLGAMVASASGDVSEAEEYLDAARSGLEQLSGKQSKIERLKQQRQVSYALDQSRKQKRQRQLDKLRRMKKEEFDKIVVLQQSAEEMGQILNRLQAAAKSESSRPAAPANQRVVSSFAAYKGSLPSPAKGEVIVPFGSATHPVTHLKSFSPGIAIQAKPNAAVSAVGDGTVAYTGNLRGYGNFVIVDHDGVYFTTYAGLGATSVTTGQTVVAGMRLGQSDQTGVVRFELRKGREALDPAEWIRLDAF
jgi:septal ring factor EnvC (AmiA/AmiB activator)